MFGGPAWRLMHIWSSHIIQQSMDQPGKVANPARGQLISENEYSPVPVHALEFGLARQVQPSRPASACSFSILRLNLVLRYDSVSKH